MTALQDKRGAAPVGYVAELDALEAASVTFLRLWSDGGEARTRMSRDFEGLLGRDQGRRAAKCFDDLCRLCALHGRRPMMRHAVSCQCLGADEACFATFIATAVEGDVEDAMLMATLLVRVDVAPVVAALAGDVGRAIKQMHLRALRDVAPDRRATTLH